MLKTFFSNFSFLTAEEVEAFLHVVTPLTLKKGEFLIREGETSKHIAYIRSGILRSFYHSTEGEDVTYCFTFENALITAYSSWITQASTTENIQALSDTELLLISKEQVTHLEVTYPNWMRFFKHVAETEFINLEKRVFLLQRESAETRYRELLTHYPEYLRTIPLQYLASYLGITQRHLSRIRRNLDF